MKTCARCGDPVYEAEGPEGRYTCKNGSNRNPQEPCIHGKNGSCFWGVPSRADFYCSFKFMERNFEATLDEVSSLMYLTRERIRQIEIEALTKFREAWEATVGPWEEEKSNGHSGGVIDPKTALSNILALVGMFGGEEPRESVTGLSGLEDEGEASDDPISLEDIDTLEDMVKIYNEDDDE